MSFQKGRPCRKNGREVTLSSLLRCTLVAVPGTGGGRLRQECPVTTRRRLLRRLSRRNRALSP
jgi:hypothetical protein